MGKRGFPKAATTIKIERGTHRKNRDGDPALEPQMRELVAMPANPEELGEAGVACWNRNGQMLIDAGLLTVADLDEFLAYCKLFDQDASADEAIAEYGEYQRAENGTVRQNPAINRKLAILDAQRRFRAKFGMTPSDRAGMQIDPAKKKGGIVTRKRSG